MADERGSDEAPVSDPATEVYDRCASCGTALARGAWHPTVGHTVDGEYRIVRFCSEACHQDWESSHDDG